MPKIAHFGTVMRSISEKSTNVFKDAQKKLKKLGFAVHRRDGRLYVPEANRGPGVGYGRHGAP